MAGFFSGGMSGQASAWLSWKTGNALNELGDFTQETSRQNVVNTKWVLIGTYNNIQIEINLRGA